MRFQCQTLSNGVPATVATSPQWQNQPRQLIRWLEPLAREAGYTPLRRCREVSNRLNKQFSKGAQYI
ncbi:MAG: COP23 domain-containing protein, partial [Microcystis panniformis]